MNECRFRDVSRLRPSRGGLRGGLRGGGLRGGGLRGGGGGGRGLCGRGLSLGCETSHSVILELEGWSTFFITHLRRNDVTFR